jgi:hypothetical protein
MRMKMTLKAVNRAILLTNAMQAPAICWSVITPSPKTRGASS